MRRQLWYYVTSKWYYVTSNMTLCDIKYDIMWRQIWHYVTSNMIVCDVKYGIMWHQIWYDVTSNMIQYDVKYNIVTSSMILCYVKYDIMRRQIHGALLLTREAECGYRGYRRYRAATYSSRQQASRTKLFYWVFVLTVKSVHIPRASILFVTNKYHLITYCTHFWLKFND